VGGNAILLSNGHVNQLIEIFCFHQIQPFLELGVQASTEAITFAGIRVRM
jgi:hypothetical protein